MLSKPLFPLLLSSLIGAQFLGGCGGEAGKDLFSKAGSSGVITGTGGAASASGGTTAQSSGGTSWGGAVATALGGSASASGGSASGGSMTTDSGGSAGSSSGGSNSGGATLGGSAGATLGGGGSAGATLGGGGGNAGAPSEESGGSGGSGGSMGGRDGGGGSAGENCDTMHTRLSSLLEAAQACNLAMNRRQCGDTVDDECGCAVPVNDASSQEAEQYVTLLERASRLCPVQCARIVCLSAPISACVSDDRSSTTGHCGTLADSSGNSGSGSFP